MKTEQILEAQLILDQNKTNHILHLILSVLTGGLWLIVWLIVASNNQSRRVNVLDKVRGKKSNSVSILATISAFILMMVVVSFVISNS